MSGHRVRAGWPLAWLVAGVVGAGASDAGARADTPTRSEYEPGSGRSLLNYPAHRVAEISHIRLEVTIPEMNRREMSVVETLTLRPIGAEVAELTLNQAYLDIRTAMVGEQRAQFQTDSDAETVTFVFDPPLPAGRESPLRVEYRVSNPSDGIFWTPESSGRPGRPAQLHTQGQPESNRSWFISHDFPNQRQSTEMIVTVPTGYTAISNGRLVSTETLGPGTTTFHWVQERPHPSYLVSLVVGKFDTVDVNAGGAGGAWGKLPMPVSVPVGKGGLIAGTYGQTPRMVALFERLYDQPFPWAKYAQVVVDNFAWGGMENTSATTMYHHALLEEADRVDSTIEDLIAHELTHQWFGDLLTCKSWEHTWVNEGFANYGECLWWEYRGNEPGSATLVSNTDEYQWWLLGMREALIGSDVANAPFQPGMASKVYAHANDTFESAASPYSKGAWVLHMLRMKLGDGVFFRAVAAYIDSNMDRAVETFDLRRVFERTSGLSLARFFDQWVVRPGVPELGVSLTWDAQSSKLTVGVEQTQPIDGANPAFAFTLPVRVLVPGESAWWTVSVPMETRSTKMEFVLPAEPAVVAVDPEMSVLADVRVDQPVFRWLNQLASGPTYSARAQAIEHLGRAGDPASAGDVNAALAGVVQDGSLHHGLRSAALLALAERAAGTGHGTEATAGTRDASAMEELLSLATVRLEEPRVRASLFEALAIGGAGAGEEVRARVADILVAAAGDGAMGVRAAALAGIGTLHATGHAAILTGALSTPSHDAKVQRAALGALAEFDQASGLDAVLRMTGAEQDPFARAKAAGAAARLVRHDPDRVIGVLTALLEDGEQRVSLAAGEALSHVGDPRVGEVLKRRARLSRAKFDRHMGQVWLDRWSSRSTNTP